MPSKYERMRDQVARQVLRARKDPVEYMKVAAKVEGAKHIRLNKTHLEWQRLLDAHDRAVLFAPISHGKSQQITRWRVQWELGNNPDLRIAILSSTAKLPKKMLSATKEDITRNPWTRKVFPHLRPAIGASKMWKEEAVCVERGDILPDPSIQIFGAHGAILGSRLDLVVIDDLCTLENTLTQGNRDKLYNWISSEVMSRLPRKGGRIWALGHVWHEDDVLHRLSRLEGYATKKYSCYVQDDDGKEVPLIPEMWTKKALKLREDELGPTYSQLMLRNKLVDDKAARIKREWFQPCLQRGRGYSFVDHWDPNDAPTYTGVDLGVRKSGAETVMFTVAVMPEGSRRIIDIRHGHWSAPEIVKNLQDVHFRYGSQIAVENNAAQQFIVDFANELATLPVKGHHTGINKRNHQFGVESIGLELSNGKWIIPCDEHLRPVPAVAQWIREAIGYSPTEHMGDFLAACWICREAIRQSPVGTYPEGYFDTDTLTR